MIRRSLLRFLLTFCCGCAFALPVGASLPGTTVTGDHQFAESNAGSEKVAVIGEPNT
jgi:hypothetical protein